MSSLPLHPAVVHLPLALAVLVPAIGLVVAALVHRGKLPRFAWAGVLALQLVLVGSGFAALRSGEADEDVVERVVPKAAIHAHEEAAELFVGAAAALLIAFALGLALPRRGWRTAAMAASIAGSVGVAVLALDVGRLGGELVYTHGAAAAHGASVTQLEEHTP